MFTVTWTHADPVSDIYGSEYVEVSDLEEARILARDWAAESADPYISVSVSQNGITLDVFNFPSA